MSEIKKLIERLCPDGVEYKKLGEICKTISAPRKLQKNEYQNEGLFPVIDQGQEFIVGYTDETEGLLPSSEYVLYGDHTRIVKYYLGSFMQGADGLKILKFNNLILTRYAYHAICHYNIPSVGYRRHWSLAKEIEIPVPPIEVQSKIVEILDNFTELEAELEIKLEAELEARRKQYEYYRNQLLTFDLPDGKAGKDKGARFDVKWMKLIDVLEQPITDGPHETPKFYDVGVPFISVDAIVNNLIDFSKKRGFISEEYDNICRKKYAPKMHDIYLVKSGSTTGKVAIVKTEERFNIWSPLAAIRVNKDNDPFYVFYVLQTKQVQDQIQQKCSKGSQPNLSMRVLEKFIIPVPPLSEQKRIVSILDRFEALTTDLQSGLPAEIEARRKQYEYYREKLLTFKRKTA